MRSQCSRSPEQCKKERKEEKVLGKIPGIETYRDLNEIRAITLAKTEIIYPKNVGAQVAMDRLTQRSCG